MPTADQRAVPAAHCMSASPLRLQLPMQCTEPAIQQSSSSPHPRIPSGKAANELRCKAGRPGVHAGRQLRLHLHGMLSPAGHDQQRGSCTAGLPPPTAKMCNA